MKVEFFKHSIDENDIARVSTVLRSVFLTNAHVTKQFEEQFSLYLNVPYCVGVNSGTAALHLSLVGLGIGEGDEVITTPMTFVATANTILYTGAKPVFVDVERDTGNIDASKIEEKITNRTKAILPVHLYGNMADMTLINKIAKKHNLKVIEDSAHCIEGRRDNNTPGQLSDAACFSFYATKNITSGEGGAIVCRDNSLRDKLNVLRLHGINKDATSRYYGKFQHWDMEEMGYKYNMSDIQASLLGGQLKRLEENLKTRERIALFYSNEFDKAGIDYIHIPKGVKSARHLFPILIENRDNIILRLQESGISTAVHYTPVHLNSFYKKRFGYKRGDFPVAEELGRKVLSIPIYPKLSEEEYNYVATQLKEISEENSK